MNLFVKRSGNNVHAGGFNGGFRGVPPGGSMDPLNFQSWIKRATVKLKKFTPKLSCGHAPTPPWYKVEQPLAKSRIRHWDWMH